MSTERGLDILSKFEDARILVIGDIMVDEFIWGKVSRISPEAPVPVVNVVSESLCLGGGANVVNNVRSLDGGVMVCGVVGDDEMGRRLISDLDKYGIDTEGVIVDGARPTTIKTRVIAHNQQVVRYDRESASEISQSTREKIVSFVKKNLHRLDAIIISDYGKGVTSEKLIGEVLNIAGENSKIISVDPKVSNFSFYKGVTAITPNNNEASEAGGMEIRDEETLLRVAEVLMEKLACKILLITRGEQGMTLFEENGEITHIPALTKEVYDVTGAGDTVISVLTLALTAGATIKEAAVIANYAAGIVVGEVGTATVSRCRLAEVIGKKIEEG